MKITLPEQLTEQEAHMAELLLKREAGEDVQTRIDRTMGTMMTLELLKMVEPEFRAFMAERSKAA